MLRLRRNSVRRKLTTMSYSLTFLPIMYTSLDTMAPCRRVLGVGRKKERPECSWLNKARSFSATNSVMSGEQESANRLGLRKRLETSNNFLWIC